MEAQTINISLCGDHAPEPIDMPFSVFLGMFTY